MDNDQKDFARWIQDLTARSVAEQMRAFQRYQELVQRVMRGDLNEQQVREEYMRFARDETTRYTRDLASLSLGYYNALLDLGRTYNDRFFEQVVRSERRDDRPPDGAAPRQRVEIELRAPVGQEATASFVVENKRTQTAEISFLVSEFVEVGGGVPFRPPLQLQPPRFPLGPLEEGVVQMRLLLLPELFTPDRRYTATVLVRGYDELELVLDVWAGRPAGAGVTVHPSAAEHVAEEALAPDKPKRARRKAGAIRTPRARKPAASRPKRSRRKADGDQPE